MISCLGSFQNDPRSFWNYLNHVTLRRSVPRRPGRAGWLRRRPRTDGRVEVRAKPVPKLVEPRTFEQCVLKEEHSHQTFGQWRRHRSDVQSGLPSTTLDHVSATQQRVPRNNYPYNRRGRGCLLAPSTTRTPPAGTLPPLSSNVCFANYLLGYVIE